MSLSTLMESSLTAWYFIMHFETKERIIKYMVFEKKGKTTLAEGRDQ